MCSSSTPTVLRNCCLSVCSPWHWNTCPFIPSVFPLKAGPRFICAPLLVLFDMFLGRSRPRPPLLRTRPPLPPDVAASGMPPWSAGLLLGAGSLIVKENVVWGAKDLGAVCCLYRDAACGDVAYDTSICLGPLWVSNPYPVSDGKSSRRSGLSFRRNSCGPCRCCGASVVSAKLSEACYQRVLSDLQSLELCENVLDVFVSHE
jgi:hypothetical protein